MQEKISKLFKLSAELGLSLRPDSPLLGCFEMSETDLLRLSVTELVEEYEVNDNMLDEYLAKFAEIKRKAFEIKIIDSGRSIDSLMELKELKARGIEKLVDIPNEVKKQVRGYEEVLQVEQQYLSDLRKKSKASIVEEFGLLPNMNFRIVISFVLTFFSAIFVFLGYVASTDERYFDKDFGYWSMLIGGLALIVTLNLFVIRVFQLVRFQMHKQRMIEELAIKYLIKVEAHFESTEKKLREQIFRLEQKVYTDSCRAQLKETMKEQKALLYSVSEHFS